ncbi:DNA-directed RNA polymerase subunit omega [Candidatus Arthromitus sp. SFB-turkey]|uniref:DNA-directed RNA polymerase subunit omega n=1 Tax=Candidatus Arthromitus sp. SFB-turkey TaxID=1840217 RepID=UPI0007F37D14|nr:DNA-directed RNA polymerase subunit omega [Candidatus Arthromitus sp. SFB-turkey]OAT89703.1 DNA-directed RNA polymerase subunit omega [Candidatus Arthromitus sp. SFB-turkey]HJD00657.1 DNA-directed RNA polymerase subunit omega [Candidatus Dwaynia gallinarum]
MKDSIVEPSISELLKKVNNKFSLVILSARVARQNIDKDKDVKQEKHINYLTQSVRQIYEDKVQYKMIDVE